MNRRVGQQPGSSIALGQVRHLVADTGNQVAHAFEMVEKGKPADTPYRARSVADLASKLLHFRKEPVMDVAVAFLVAKQRPQVFAHSLLQKTELFMLLELELDVDLVNAFPHGQDVTRVGINPQITHAGQAGLPAPFFVKSPP